MKVSQPAINQNTATLTFTASTQEVNSAKNLSLRHLGKDVKLSGFRPGKAPLNMIADKIDAHKLHHHMLHHLLEDHLPQAIKKHQLQAIGNPQIKKTLNPKNKPWEITIDIPLLPQFKLGDYKQKSRQALKKADKAATPDQKVNLVCQALTNHLDFPVPQSLVDKEVNHSLARLISQTETLGLSMEQYLKSLDKTGDQLRQEYTKQAQDNLKLEFILLEIAKDLKLKVDDKEIRDLIDASGDAQTKDRLAQPEEKPYLTSILLKRKAIDFLLKN